LLSKNLKVKIYRNIILPVVLYGCETLSLILKEDHRLRVFEKSVLRRIFGPKRDELTVNWRKLHNEDLNDVLLTQYFSGGQIEKDETGGACNTYGGRAVYTVLVGKRERKRTLGRPRRRWDKLLR